MTKKLAVAYYNLSIMLDAGMPLLRSLDTTAAGLKGNLKNAFSVLAKRASAGDSLAETMRKHPWVFAPLDVMLVEVAEMSGNLPQSLKHLSQWYEFCNRLKHIIISGLLLPAVIITIAAPIIPL
ncbi:MAG: type II secretion system F family protein, partial [Phycisphaerae bacterium]